MTRSWDQRSTSEASSVRESSSAPSATACSLTRRSSLQSKPWGVWMARSRVRSTVPESLSWASIRRMVSTTGSTGMTARCSRSAAATSRKTWAGVRQRAASWTSTLAGAGPWARRSRAARTLAARVCAPVTGCAPSSRHTALSCSSPAGTVTTIRPPSAHTPESRTARRLCSRMVRPASPTRALGMPRPRRCPEPAATTTTAHPVPEEGCAVVGAVRPEDSTG